MRFLGRIASIVVARQPLLVLRIGKAAPRPEVATRKLASLFGIVRHKREDILIIAVATLGAHRLVELEDKIENGTLRDFPCTVGDEVFWACDLDKQYSQHMHGVVIGLSVSPKNTVWVSVKYDDGLSFDHKIESFGKSVFLTKAEAEAKEAAKNE